jgi:hypothetical protein
MSSGNLTEHTPHNSTMFHESATAPLTGTKTDMRNENNRRVREALEALVGEPPRNTDLRYHSNIHQLHHVSTPRMSIGLTNTLDAGRYYQMVSNRAHDT